MRKAMQDVWCQERKRNSWISNGRTSTVLVENLLPQWYHSYSTWTPSSKPESARTAGTPTSASDAACCTDHCSRSHARAADTATGGRAEASAEGFGVFGNCKTLSRAAGPVCGPFFFWEWSGYRKAAGAYLGALGRTLLGRIIETT